MLHNDTSSTMPESPGAYPAIPNNKYRKGKHERAKGVAIGALIGTTIYPGPGTVIGAGIGIFVGAVVRHNRKKKLVQSNEVRLLDTASD